MKRDLKEDLLRWKDQKPCIPLIVRGARQVGKSFLIQQFGKEEFSNLITVNFERSPEFKNLFGSLDPKKIVETIELVLGKSIIPGKTLLFFDEIQECPEAISSLRYFKEEMPDLHVIAAGSLLEFILNDPDFRMPVGRVQFFYLRPLSFGEYLEASGNSKLRSYLSSLHIQDAVPLVIHDKLLSLTVEYFALGGMPSAVDIFLQTKSLLQIQELQSSILLAYKKDFGKYADRTPYHHLENIFSKAPGLVGQWVKYSSLDPETSPTTLKNALKKLSDAGLLSLLYATSAAGLPFITHKNEKKYKLFFLDIGLVKRACHLDLELLLKESPLLINKGALAEQFVAQELLAYFSRYEQDTLFSWVREEKSSSAEVDFLIAVSSWIVPIEVKSGAIGSLRSLKLFLQEKEVALGVRISENPISLEKNILSIPFYMVEQLPRLVKEFYLTNSK